MSLTDNAVTRGVSRFWNAPFFRAFRSAPSGVAGMVIILILINVVIFAPIFLSDRAERQDFSHVYEDPSWQFPLGTDSLGRDIFARLLVATRLSLQLAVVAAAIALAIGLTIGTFAALLGPRVRPFVLRIIDILLSFPGILTAIFVSVIIGAGALGAMLGIGIALSFSYARVTSTLAMSVGGREYISAARVVGVKRRRLMLRYILPNIAEPLLIATSVSIAAAILSISALSFLGLGVQPPDYDWGRMLTEGVRAIYQTPAAALGPAAFIAVSAIAFGFTGEALARAMNPLLWTAPKKTAAAAADGAAPPELEPGAAPAGAAPALASGNGRANGSGGGGAGTATVAPAGDGVALSVQDLVVTFPGPAGPIEVVKGVSFAVRAGELIGIVGESGSGKTMTALSIAQLTPFPGRVSGQIILHGTDLKRLPRRRLDRFLGTDLAVVFQDPMSSMNPALRIGAQLTEAIRIHKRMDRRKANDLAIAGLTEVHIPAAGRQIKRYPHEFSGGMRQRAMIAKGLIKEPTLLIADEPTTALDVTIQAQIMDLLNEVNGTHQTAIILISHNLALVSQNCHRVLVMYAGRIVEELGAEHLTTNPLHPYTRALLGAVPEIGQARDVPLEYIPGEIPDISSPPPGCPYHPRCPLAIDRCRAERPPLVTRPDATDRRVACHVANADLE
jgi:oligopeptide/dipeptide ABC transporter ATP-binding protein